MTLFVGIRKACNEVGVPWYCRFLTDKNLLSPICEAILADPDVARYLPTTLAVAATIEGALAEGIIEAGDEEALINAATSIVKRTCYDVAGLPSQTGVFELTYDDHDTILSVSDRSFSLRYEQRGQSWTASVVRLVKFNSRSFGVRG